MGIESVCKTNVVTAQKQTRVHDAALLLRDNDVGCLIVTERQGNKNMPVGVVTDRDLALAISSNRSVADWPLSQIMMIRPVTIKHTEGIYEAIKRMNEFGVKRLPVVHDDGSLYGIVCADDLLVLMAEEISQLAGITESRIASNRAPRTFAELHVSI